MEFNIVAVTKLAVGICVVWLMAMGAIYLHLKRERNRKRSGKAY